MNDNGRSPYVTATAVTTRTATTHEDLEKNAKTSQVCTVKFFSTFIGHDSSMNGIILPQAYQPGDLKIKSLKIYHTKPNPKQTKIKWNGRKSLCQWEKMIQISCLFQVEEKTVAHTMTTSATRQEQRVVTQEVRATSTVLSGSDSQVS